jgi:type VI secretion system protein ImpL
MNTFKSVLSVSRGGRYWRLVSAITLSMLFWFFGDLITIADSRPFGTPVMRLLVILAIAVTWGLLNLLEKTQGRCNDGRLVTPLVEPATTRPPAAAEVEELRERFNAVLGQLKRSPFDKKGSRRLPWYIVVGPPGSGKSMALARAGLGQFCEQIQKGWETEVGGTRNCNWIITDEAVILDTAGRYTTQDSDPEADRLAWLGLLNLLKRRRRSVPLNGVVVALSAGDLMEEHINLYSRQIHLRLAEVEARLSMRLPVYLLITKLDLIAGFEAFLGSLGEIQRQQVWGYTFDCHPTSDDQQGPNGLREVLAELVTRLDQHTPRKVYAEPDLDRRALIFSFPVQVAKLSDDIVSFVDRCFRTSPQYKGGRWLRGVYLTSATQEGISIDRLRSEVAQRIGAAMTRPTIASSNRGFFLYRLFKDVIFQEAALAKRNGIFSRLGWRSN